MIQSKQTVEELVLGYLEEQKQELREEIDRLNQHIENISCEHYQQLIKEQSKGLDRLSRLQKEVVKKEGKLRKRRQQIDKYQHKIKQQEHTIAKVNKQTQILHKKINLDRYKKGQVSQNKKNAQGQKSKLQDNKMKYSYILNKKEQLLSLIEKENEEITLFRQETENIKNINISTKSRANTISTRDYERTISVDVPRVCQLTSINQFNIN